MPLSHRNLDRLVRLVAFDGTVSFEHVGIGVLLVVLGVEVSRIFAGALYDYLGGEDRGGFEALLSSARPTDLGD